MEKEYIYPIYFKTTFNHDSMPLDVKLRLSQLNETQLQEVLISTAVRGLNEEFLPVVNAGGTYAFVGLAEELNK